MTIALGDRLPSAVFFAMGEDGPVRIESRSYFAGRKILLFSSPGAFTPTDTNIQLPGYLELADDIRPNGFPRWPEWVRRAPFCPS